jgi:cell division cycle 2-like protein
MWSVGCVFGELVGKDPILQGRGELDQVDQIFSLVGSPTEASWPGFGALPNAGLFRWKPRAPEGALLPQRFPVAAPVSGNRAFLDSNGYDLLRGLLALDPARRLTARAALGHRYFSEGVAPATPRFFSSS